MWKNHSGIIDEAKMDMGKAIPHKERLTTQSAYVRYETDSHISQKYS